MNFLINLNQSLQNIVTETQAHYTILLIILAVPWSIFIINSLCHRCLLSLGIIPRRLEGLIGIIMAPLLHANFNHLFFNSIPLVVLSDFILIQGLPYYLIVTAIITLISGLLIWCFARPGLHVGASAVITGYWGLLILQSIQHPDITTLILAGLSLYYFAGIFYGIFPQQKGVSNEGHLFGLLAGFVTPYLISLA